MRGDYMTIIEALAKAEDILGTLSVEGRDKVKKVNAIFDLLEASINAMTAHEETKENDNHE
jgi:hypothetical protein